MRDSIDFSGAGTSQVEECVATGIHTHVLKLHLKGWTKPSPVYHPGTQ